MYLLEQTLIFIFGLLLLWLAIRLYRGPETISKLVNKLYPDHILELREQMVGLLYSKIEIIIELTGVPHGKEVAKVDIRENDPCQSEDEDIYVRAYREKLYVKNFELDIIDPLNKRLVKKGVEVYQYYLTRDAQGVYLVFELRANPAQE